MMTTEITYNENFDTDGAAAYLCSTRGTLANMRCRVEGPRFFKKGGKILYRKMDLDAYIAAHIVETRGSR